MGSFTFRLQKVLDYRTKIEDQKKQEFMKARLDYTKQEEKLNSLKMELQDCIKKGWLFSDVFHYQVMNNYITFMNEKIDKQYKVTKSSKKIMDEKKSEYTESRINRKVIDKLKENAFDEYKKDSDSIEQKQNDEFALYGYMRK